MEIRKRVRILIVPYLVVEAISDGCLSVRLLKLHYDLKTKQQRVFLFKFSTVHIYENDVYILHYLFRSANVHRLSSLNMT